MSAVAVDPALQLTLRAGLALLFLVSAHHKLRHFASFRAAVANYRLLPEAWAGGAGGALAAAELAAGLGLLMPGVHAAAAVGGAGLLAVYAAAIGTNLARGRRDIDCGCSGPRHRRPLSEALVVRNAVLVAAAVACALPVAERGLLWVDALSVVAGAATLALLYAAIDASLANAPRLRRLGGRV